jgi:hypothetical protein
MLTEVAGCPTLRVEMCWGGRISSDELSGGEVENEWGKSSVVLCVFICQRGCARITGVSARGYGENDQHVRIASKVSIYMWDDVGLRVTMTLLVRS